MSLKKVLIAIFTALIVAILLYSYLTLNKDFLIIYATIVTLIAFTSVYFLIKSSSKNTENAESIKIDNGETREFKISQKECKSLIENSQIGIFTTTIEGEVLYANDSLMKIMGYESLDELRGKNIINAYKDPAQRACFLSELREHGRVDNIEMNFLTKNREEKVIQISAHIEGNIISGICTDITERVEMEKNLEKLATTDKLTCIYNRHKFDEIFKTEVERASRYKTPLTLIMFDIDHFKYVNDNHGHGTGDEVLQGVVNIVKKNIRDADIFARWGGEEFVILSPQTDSKSATALTEKLRKTIESYSFVKDLTITCSFGIAFYEDKDSTETLIKRADAALYRAKNQGRNRVEV
ncbi:sensor domain-containing diguanylate cyclase [Sulfurimonas sp.]|uniref:sensor domain-containing diguanylate cyclase n=1 Tax=Sulfurimonas sp. TaxID=2022749 RepID=UPI0019FB06D2|nr:sensor domain-containing diguanylate cyclase [Sulfurimonas sp.]MBE0514134.1 GGDEF domain-containing protein [Sulfurimonas sp.]